MNSDRVRTKSESNLRFAIPLPPSLPIAELKLVSGLRFCDDAAGNLTNARGDTLRVAVEGGVVKYKKNGTVVYTSTVAPTYPLLADTSIYTNGGTLNNVVISGAGGGSSAIQWLVTDQLGTPRMVFDQTGSLANVSRHDYLPFGEELFASTGGRTQAQGYTFSDNVRQKFTSKERDNETGLDYFLARYYSSTQGRFTGVDLEQEGARNDDPQSWNGYSYTGGNPLARTDPEGKKYLVCGPDGKSCTQVSDDDFWNERKEFEKTGNVYTGSRDFYESGQIKNAEGGIVATYVQISIDDPTREFIFQMRRQTAPIPRATATFFGISAVLGAGGGALLHYAVIPSLAPTVTTLGLRAAPAAAGAAGVLSQMGRTDASIIQKAIDLGASGSDAFRDNVFKLTDAVFQIVGPSGKVEPMGRIGDSIIYGGRIGGVGIAEVNGVTVVVKMVHGNPQILGPLP